MAIEVTGTLENFYPGTTVRFSVTILYNGVVPDISLDTCTITFKHPAAIPDTQATLIATADVVTLGATGTAIFALTPAETTALVENTLYFYDIVWRLSTGEEYVLTVGSIKILGRISDQ